jgi:hypothetical protein
MEDIIIFCTTSASFQTFEVTNTATINNVVISGSLSFASTSSYSLPFAICKIPFLNTEGQTYDNGIQNEISLDSAFSINSGEFESRSRASRLYFDKDGYYNINAFITLNFTAYPDDVVDIRIYDSNTGLALVTKTQVISSNSSLLHTIDIGNVLALMQRNSYIYVTIKTSSNKFDVLSTTNGESLLSVTQIR